jgi:hypothetical protein
MDSKICRIGNVSKGFISHSYEESYDLLLLSDFARITTAGGCQSHTRSPPPRPALQDPTLIPPLGFHGCGEARDKYFSALQA